MPDAAGSSNASGGSNFLRAAQVIVVSSVMFSFISYWRTAAVVLCDLASTVYYIGGIVENAIGPAAPWFILAVMLLSGVVSLVYIESCALLVRGGVYRVVKGALGVRPSPDLSATAEINDVAAADAPDAARFNPQAQTHWVREPSRPDRLERALDEDGRPVLK